MIKNSILLSSLSILAAVSISFIAKPADTSANKKNIVMATGSAASFSANSIDHSAKAADLSANLFDKLELGAKGLSKKTLEIAVNGFVHLKDQGTIKNSDLLTIVDFSQSSRKKRFYLIDMKKKKLLKNTYVAHGKNTGLDIANKFSNTPESEKSSLGFYTTKTTYAGKNGYSLRMSGLEKGFNDNAERRAIVVHGADYVNANRVKSMYMGRSQGCPALPKEEYKEVIDLIKNESVFFIYYPDSLYLSTSTILND